MLHFKWQSRFLQAQQPSLSLRWGGAEFCSMALESRLVTTDFLCNKGCSFYLGGGWGAEGEISKRSKLWWLFERVKYPTWLEIILPLKNNNKHQRSTPLEVVDGHFCPKEMYFLVRTECHWFQWNWHVNKNTGERERQLPPSCSKQEVFKHRAAWDPFVQEPEASSEATQALTYDSSKEYIRWVALSVCSSPIKQKSRGAWKSNEVDFSVELWWEKGKQRPPFVTPPSFSLGNIKAST